MTEVTSVTHTDPEIGAVLDTVYGRQRVMDVLDAGHDRRTVYLRPERGGMEWTIAATDLGRVMRAPGDSPASHIMEGKKQDDSNKGSQHGGGGSDEGGNTSDGQRPADGK
ncbi:hypothetical protein [Yinghuangia sp. YIM S09857]|uniref:hypothetical protein n=1 Tax=Yinghuangia sp. YIM S09857 TaxID=3436929 RepID=UPI003F53B40D